MVETHAYRFECENGHHASVLVHSGETYTHVFDDHNDYDPILVKSGGGDPHLNVTMPKVLGRVQTILSGSHTPV